MTVNATTSAVLIPGTGTTATLPFGWQIAQASDLIVMTQVVATGVITTLALGTGYTVNGAGIATGGTVTLTAGNLATGVNAFIASDPAELQLLLLSQANNANQADLMAALDLLTRMVQATRRVANNALQIPLVESLAVLNTTFPAAAERANLFPAFDSLGNVIVSPGPTGTGVPISAAMVPVVQAPTLAAGRLALGISAAMDPVVTASTLALARAAMGPWGDAVSTATGALTSRTFADRFAEVVDVRDFGAVGNGATDDHAAFVAAVSRLVAIGGGTLVIPPGNYVNSATVAIAGVPVSIRGFGGGSSTVNMTGTSGACFAITGATVVSLQGMAFVGGTVRPAGNYQVTVATSGRVFASGNYFNVTDGFINVTGSNTFVTLSDMEGDSLGTGGLGNTCLKLQNCGGTIAGCNFRTSTGAANPGQGPCVYVTGPATSMHFDNCDFQGGGPRSKWAITSITGSGSAFTITTTATHDFRAGEYVAVRGSNIAGYNSFWRIASVTATTIVVTSTQTGAGIAQGTAESRAACMYVSNENGAVNESLITNVLFEALSTRLYGSASLFFDAHRNTINAQPTIEGWCIGTIYCDYGTEGVVMWGASADGGGDPCCFGFNIGQVMGLCPTRGVVIDQACGITIGNVQTDTGGSSQTDGVSIPAAVYVYAGAAAPFSRGVTMAGSNIGTPRSFQDNLYVNNGYNNGVLLDTVGIQDLTITGCNIYGGANPIGYANSPEAAGQRWKIEGNILTTGAPAFTATSTIPSVASATSTAIPAGYDVVKITGTTTITTLTGAWIGRRVTLLFTGALTLGTGGNLAIAAPLSILAGQQVVMTFDGNSWYAR